MAELQQEEPGSAPVVVIVPGVGTGLEHVPVFGLEPGPELELGLGLGFEPVPVPVPEPAPEPAPGLEPEPGLEPAPELVGQPEFVPLFVEFWSQCLSCGLAQASWL